MDSMTYLNRSHPLSGHNDPTVGVTTALTRQVHDRAALGHGHFNDGHG